MKLIIPIFLVSFAVNAEVINNAPFPTGHAWSFTDNDENTWVCWEYGNSNSPICFRIEPKTEKHCTPSADHSRVLCVDQLTGKMPRDETKLKVYRLPKEGRPQVNYITRKPSWGA